MNFLIAYATTEGQTRKIAQFTADRIKLHDHTADLIDATEAESAAVKLRGYDGAIVAGSLHIGKFQASIADFVKARHQTLNGMRSMFLGVSLAAASKDADDMKGLADCMRGFLADTGWMPGETHNVAGAFRYTQYDFFKRWGMKLIAYQKGVSTDTSRDLELTDWAALTRAIDGFVATVEVSQRAMART
jgi:menaquinone-dependent protoporphyrinogen oxidase